MKSGKYTLGYKTVLKTLRSSKGLCVFLLQFIWCDLFLILFVLVINGEFGQPEFVILGKLILIANNCPPLRKSEIEYYAMLAKIGVHHYNGSELTLSNSFFAGFPFWFCLIVLFWMWCCFSAELECFTSSFDLCWWGLNLVYAVLKWQPFILRNTKLH